MYTVHFTHYTNRTNGEDCVRELRGKNIFIIKILFSKKKDEKNLFKKILPVCVYYKMCVCV